jgi:hypothetical protein
MNGELIQEGILRDLKSPLAGTDLLGNLMDHNLPFYTTFPHQPENLA